jgi:hypothetical protein
VPSQGQVIAADAVWHLPAAEVPDAPRPGDVIVHGDDRWTVLEVRCQTLAGRWRCQCRNLAVAHGLNSYVDIQRASYVKSAGGSQTPSWSVWKAGVQARIQPAETQVQDEHETKKTEVRVTIYLAEDVAIDHTHRIRGADGAIYSVLGSRKEQRIDALLEIDAVRASEAEEQR